MAAPKQKTGPCPTCNGTGVVQGRYTEPEVVCSQCGGEGIVPSEEKTAAAVVDEVEAATFDPASAKDGEGNG